MEIPRKRTFQWECKTAIFQNLEGMSPSFQLTPLPVLFMLTYNFNFPGVIVFFFQVEFGEKVMDNLLYSGLHVFIAILP